MVSCSVRAHRYHTAKTAKFRRLGEALATWPRSWVVPAVVAATVCLLAVGMIDAVIETDVDRLWVESGGRLETEMEYVADNIPIDPGDARSQQVIIATGRPEGQDVLTAGHLQAHLDTLVALNNITVTVSGADFMLKDLCYKVDAPAGFGGATALIPCTRITVMDCFKEGGYDFPEALAGLIQTPAFAFLSDDFGITGYAHRPSFADPSTDIKAQVRYGCKGYAEKIKAMTWSAGLIIGGVERTGDPETGPVTKATAFQSVILLGSAAKLAAQLRISESEATQALSLWRTRFLEVTQAPPTAESPIATYSLASDSLDRLMERVSSASGPLLVAGYAIMVAFVAIAMTRWGHPESQTILGLVGLVLVACSTLGAFGFTTLLGVKFNASSTQVLPFLALGLGVDDLFVLAFTLRRIRRTMPLLPPEQQAGEAMAAAMSSITLTSIANFLAFLAGALVPLPAVTAFCLQAAAVVAFNYLSLVLAMPGLFMFHAWLVKRRVAKTKAAAAGAPSAADPAAAAPAPPNPTTDARPPSCARRLCARQYARLYLSQRWRVGVAVAGVAVLAVCLYGASIVDDGLELNDIAPSDSQESMFIERRFEYFSLFAADIMVGRIDYPNNQLELLKLEADLAQLPYVNNVPESWLKTFIGWVNTTGTLDSNDVVPSARFYPWLNRWTTETSSQIEALIAGAEFFGYDDQGYLSLSTFTMYLKNLVDVDDFVAMINDVRGLCEATGLEVWPAGVPFTFWEQYIHLRDFMAQNVGIALGAVFLVTLLLLFDLVSAIIVALTILVTITEIFGVMGFIGIKFSALPAVSIIMSVGIAVEFTAHLVQAYQTSDKRSRPERTVAALSEMGLPILNGGLSTQVGLVMLVFSEFGFIVKYFFGIFTGVVLIGLFNGLVVLPAVLSWVGPAAAATEGSTSGQSDGTASSHDRSQQRSPGSAISGFGSARRLEMVGVATDHDEGHRAAATPPTLPEEEPAKVAAAAEA